MNESRGAGARARRDRVRRRAARVEVARGRQQGAGARLVRPAGPSATSGPTGCRCSPATCSSPTPSRPALEGCDAAYYLVHSIGTGGDFAATEATAARNVRDAADAAGLRRIVYLGGMGSGDDLSKHLASRHRVGEILASGRTPTTELRAAVIIGSGSISFEMLRYLTEVLPGDGDPAMGPYEVPADRDQ